jgi:molybdate transport system substrate-binding protein
MVVVKLCNSAILKLHNPPVRRLLAAACLALTAACAEAREPAPSAPVTIFAAASLESALTDVDATVWQRRRQRVRLTFAGTPQLARQIEAGAPADIFISADDRWMQVLVDRRHVQAGSRRVLLANTLVLVAPQDAAVSVDVTSVASLRAALGDGRLAIADPEHVPAGRYAREALTHTGVWAALADRLAPHENVRAALAFVARGEAPLGIVYASDAVDEPSVRVVHRFDAGSHTPIHYPAALTATAGPTAADVLADLASPEARVVFERHGFIAPAR